MDLSGGGRSFGRKNDKQCTQVNVQTQSLRMKCLDFKQKGRSRTECFTYVSLPWLAKLNFLKLHLASLHQSLPTFLDPLSHAELLWAYRFLLRLFKLLVLLDVTYDLTYDGFSKGVCASGDMLRFVDKTHKTMAMSILVVAQVLNLLKALITVFK